METYSSILDTLDLSTLECNTVTLVLETLGSDETLDLGGFGVWFLAFGFGLNFTADNEFADLCWDAMLAQTSKAKTPSQSRSRVQEKCRAKGRA